MKQAYLTIDDAPSKDFLPKLEYLNQHDIPALFFCWGEFISAHEADLLRALKYGYPIGNHTYHHPHMSELSWDDCRREISDTDRLIENLYRGAGWTWTRKYFRFPYFDTGGSASSAGMGTSAAVPVTQGSGGAEKRNKIQQYLRELGYRQPGFRGINPKYVADPTFFLDVDVRCTFDQAEYWYGNPAAPDGLSGEDAILARMDRDAPRDGFALRREDMVDVILMHDHDYTTPLFYKILERYQEAGIAFLPIP